MVEGIVLRGDDDVTERRARSAGLKVKRQDEPGVPFDKTLIVTPGPETRVPFDLLPAAFHFLDRWDAAVPLWRYGVTAADVGTPAEREATQGVVRDLRVLLHATELLFVQRNTAGMGLVETWREEIADCGPDERLAFLRAMYRIKPRLCVLPRTWLANVQGYSRQAAWQRGNRSPNASNPLVRVELEPGRFVKCHAGDEERVREQFERQRAARR